MKRIIIIATALGALVAATSAYALVVVNTYKATAKVSPGKAGTAKKPVAVGFTVDYTASGTGGYRTAAVKDIKNTVYGLRTNGKYFPMCSVNAILAAGNDTGCPKGSKVATGNLTAIVGPLAPPASNELVTNPLALPCSKTVDVFNAGQGKLVFFLLGPGSKCASIGTGALAPFPGRITVKNGTLTIDAPIPPSIGNPIPGYEGSLLTEHLAYSKQTKKGHGFFESVACKGSKRPYTTSFTADGITKTYKGTASCST